MTEKIICSREAISILLLAQLYGDKKQKLKRNYIIMLILYSSKQWKITVNSGVKIKSREATYFLALLY